MEPIPTNPTLQPPPTQHPPLLRDTLPMFKPRTVWPVVIGVIAAVFGGFGMLGGLINMASPLLMSIVPRMPAGQPDPVGGMAGWGPWLVGIGIVTTLVGGLLLMGAITLLRRHHTSRPILLWWAVVKAVLVVLYFMHVKLSSRLTKIFVVSGVFWLGILVGLTLSDYLTRDWMDYSAGWKPQAVEQKP